MPCHCRLGLGLGLGFYIPVARCNGCPNHRNHISEGLNKRTIPLKLVPQEEKDNLCDMFDASFGEQSVETMFSPSLVDS